MRHCSRNIRIGWFIAAGLLLAVVVAPNLALSDEHFGPARALPGLAILPPKSLPAVEPLPEDASPLLEALASPPQQLSAPSVLVSQRLADAPHTTHEIETPPKIWSGRIELGVNGADGNSRQTSSRTSAKAKRETPDDKLTLSFLYVTSSSEAERTQNNWLFDCRFEALYPDWPWSDFVHSTVEYDQFTAFDYRLTVDAGFAYSIANKDVTELQLRIGGGFSREYGIVDAEYVPEASFGFNFEYKLTKKQKLLAKGDMFPDVRDFSDYRIRSEAAWEIMMDEEENLSLRLSVRDRYDSTPNGKVHNDVLYSAELAFDF